MVQKTELRHIICEGRELEYQLTRKAVKNINLRIKPDGSILVSASPRVPLPFIENVIREKQEFIFRALEQYEHGKTDSDQKGHGSQENSRREHKKELLHQYPLDYQQQVFGSLCEEIFRRFRQRGYAVPYPVLKLRYMTSRWGSCQPQKGIITLNSQLIEKPYSCIEYVVIHEFAHFIQPNHSKAFYQVVEEFLPDWKERKRKLNER